MARDLVPFVQFDLPGAGTLPDGRYLIRGADDHTDAVLVSSLIGSLPSRGRLRGRRPAEESAEGEPPELPIRRVTYALPYRLDDDAGARSWLERAGKDPDELVDSALAIVNWAIAAFRVSAADPTIHEVGPDSTLAIRIGFGTGDHVAGSLWIEAIRLPPERRHKRRPGTEDIRPPQRMAAILSGRDSADPWELHALRARSDFENSRPAEAAAELRAALALFDATQPEFAANLREEIAGRLEAARATLAEPQMTDQALADAVDLFTRLQNRRRRPPID